jgi:hypothetical protein
MSDNPSTPKSERISVWVTPLASVLIVLTDGDQRADCTLTIEHAECLRHSLEIAITKAREIIASN